MRYENLVLIGMPAAGKTTVGRLLAQALGLEFLDTDELIERVNGKKLHEIIAERGLAGFRATEEAALLGLDVKRTLIATGGSVIYSEPGMRALRRLGPVAFLNCPLPVLSRRVGDPTARGMVIAPGQSFAELYEERLPLYRRYADVEIDCDELPPEVVARRVRAALAL
mgnify:CR=1 FL=1